MPDTTDNNLKSAAINGPIGDHPKASSAQTTMATVIFAIGVSHLINDALQALIPAVYPLLQKEFHLNFTEIGLVGLTFQLCASLLQPLVGMYTDQKPQPFSLSLGMSITLCGLVVLSVAWSLGIVLLAVGMIGIGSSIFHPEASRVAYIGASVKRKGTAQSVFQVGGRSGASIGPLLAASVVVPLGLGYVWVFGFLALIGIVLLFIVGIWYKKNLHRIDSSATLQPNAEHGHLSNKKIYLAIAILIILIFSKFFYLAAMNNYLTFYLIDRFGVSIPVSQVFLFVFLFSCAIGTLIGGPLGDKVGRKYIIWLSIAGVAPFTIALPFLNLAWAIVFTVFIGIILSSAFPAILVYAQELMPHKLGMISGLFYGFAFGMGGVGAVALGKLADSTSIAFVFSVCGYLPLIGLVAIALPRLHRN